MLQEQLKDLGFKSNESKIYLKLLTIGPQPASILAHQSGINRTTTYMVLKNLQQKGIVGSHQKEKTQVYSANDPNYLISYIDEKYQTYKYHRKKLLSTIPQFRSLEQKYDLKKPTLTYHDGINGIKNFINDLKESKGRIYAYHNFRKWEQEPTLKKQVEKILDTYNQAAKEIFVISPKNKSEPTSNILKTIKLQKYDPEKYPNLTNQEIIIYDNKVLAINIDPQKTFSISIENNNMANLQRTLFEITWDKLKN
ncbi:hypothetical protein CVV38_03275 [Candidatus Peregrinibacteria bacterium HGW-Peregrinibacteria-1]|jgi:sugar-specific transcriptional regulator TrmB|nr:MAG: hypothetical protein CVV38_03275 [Candidatus Peregrinibacteria bacterium HGW-Peregrinibacteria-1]